MEQSITHNVRKPLKITRHTKRQEKIKYSERKKINQSINQDIDIYSCLNHQKNIFKQLSYCNLKIKIWEIFLKDQNPTCEEKNYNI